MRTPNVDPALYLCDTQRYTQEYKQNSQIISEFSEPEFIYEIDVNPHNELTNQPVHVNSMVGFSVQRCFMFLFAYIVTSEMI